MEPVSKYHSTILNYVYFSLCLSGLIWQIVQISINYFAFSVVSDIKIIMPGIVQKKALNLCFQCGEILNYSMYDELVKKYFMTEYENKYVRRNGMDFKMDFLFNRSIEERFNLMINPNEIFQDQLNYGSKQFLISYFNCYQLYPVLNETNSMIMQSPLELGVRYRYEASNIYMKNITHMFISLSKVNFLPWSEFTTTDVVANILPEKGSTVFFISSQSYEIDKLKSPYTDHCIDYTIFGYGDREDALRKCMNEESIETYGKVSGVQIFERENILNEKYSLYGKYSILMLESDQTMWKKCLDRHKYDNCHKKFMFTKLSMKTIPILNGNTTFFALSRSRNPSFKIESKARIDDIDFVTYIFGALGSWIGFSFLVLNPFPYIVKYFIMKGNRMKNNTGMKNILRMKNSSAVNIDEENVSRIVSIMLRSRIIALEKRCEKLSNEMILLKPNMT